MSRKILFLSSNPTDTGRLRLDKEIREITEGLRRSNKRDQFLLISQFALRVVDLRRNLLDHSPQIVHFAGHDGTGGIIVEDDQGQAVQVPNDALADLFELCAEHVECVILNACYSAVQADAIAKHIPYVIGMNATLSDIAAIEFAVGFYDGLGAGRSIEDAFKFGRNALALKCIPEDLIPVLKRRSGNAAIATLTAKAMQAIQTSDKATVNATRGAFDFDRDKKQALAASGLDGIPNLLLSAYPVELVRMRGLFDPSESDLIQVLQTPPILQGDGWDLMTDEPMVNIQGRMRRSMKCEWKLLQLSREGILLFLARGDAGFLSFSATQGPADPLRIIPFALAHCIYVFALFAQQVFAYAQPSANLVTCVVQLRNMEIDGKPALLHPNHFEKDQHPPPHCYHRMPYATEGFSATAPLKTPPGEVCCELVSQIFEWFGFDRHEVPYTRFENGKRVIDELSLSNANRTRSDAIIHPLDNGWREGER